jgi:hypothetical protein
VAGSKTVGVEKAPPTNKKRSLETMRANAVPEPSETWREGSSSCGLDIGLATDEMAISRNVHGELLPQQPSLPSVREKAELRL